MKKRSLLWWDAARSEGRREGKPGEDGVAWGGVGGVPLEALGGQGMESAEPVMRPCVLREGGAEERRAANAAGERGMGEVERGDCVGELVLERNEEVLVGLEEDEEGEEGEGEEGMAREWGRGGEL